MTYDTLNDAVTMQGGEGTLLANRYRIGKPKKSRWRRKPQKSVAGSPQN